MIIIIIYRCVIITSSRGSLEGSVAAPRVGISIAACNNASHALLVSWLLYYAMTMTWDRSNTYWHARPQWADVSYSRTLSCMALSPCRTDQTLSWNSMPCTNMNWHNGSHYVLQSTAMQKHKTKIQQHPSQLLAMTDCEVRRGGNTLLMREVAMAAKPAMVWCRR